MSHVCLGGLPEEVSWDPQMESVGDLEHEHRVVSTCKTEVYTLTSYLKGDLF